MRFLRYWQGKARSFSRLPRFIRFSIVPTWLLLGVARLLVLCMPFRTVAQHLGHHAGVSVFVPLIMPDAVHRARLISRLIRITARYCPWQANCFAQAIAARVWLGGFGIEYALYFGVRKDPLGRLNAHAWVCAGPVAVTGGDDFALFTVVGTFVSNAELAGPA